MCGICGMYGQHHPRCPYYSPPKSKYICCYCSESIYKGERYLNNEQGEYIHEDCIRSVGTDWLINWLVFNYEETEE